MAEAWDVRWNDLYGRIQTFAAAADPYFVAAFLDRRDAVVEIRRCAPTDGHLADEYADLVNDAGFGNPSFRQVLLSTHDQRAITRLISEAETALDAAGIVVWSIDTDGRAGDPRIISYEDPFGHGLPQALLDDLARFPPGSVQLRRVSGPTHHGV